MSLLYPERCLVLLSSVGGLKEAQCSVWCDKSFKIGEAGPFLAL